MNVYEAMTDVVEQAAADGHSRAATWRQIHDYALTAYLEATEAEAREAEQDLEPSKAHQLRLGGGAGTFRARCSCGWAGPALADVDACRAGWRSHLGRVRRSTR